MLRAFVLLLCSVFVLGCVPKRTVQPEGATESHLSLGVNYERRGEWESAMREYALAAEMDPRGSFYLGNLLFQQNDLDAAEQQYRRAMPHMQSNPDLFNNLAWLLYTRRDNLEEAEALANAAVKLGSPERFEEYVDTLEQIRQLRKELGDVNE